MFLQGSDIFFRALSAQDAEAFYQWSCNREVVRYSLSSFALPKSVDDYRHWLASINQNKSTFELAICCKDSSEIIGYAGIAAISTLNRSGEYFILIGDTKYWGQGIGTEVTRIITDYGFNSLGLHRIELTAYSVNTPAVKAYEKVGYQHEGVKRQAGFRDGEYLDQIQMAILAPEWLYHGCRMTTS